MTPLSANDEQAVRDAFVRWVSLQAGAPRDPQSLIEHVEVTHDYIGLLETELQGRRVIWKSVPATAKVRVTPPAMAIDQVDPWSVELASLRQRSDHIAICDACGAEKKLRCAACGGTGKELCAACKGQRKTYGYAANGAYRLLNCTVCRGKGELDCGECRRGVAICATCAGEGRLQRWMEIETWQRSVANVHPEAFTSRFAWGENPPTEAVSRDAELLVELDLPHRLTAKDLGDVPADWLETLAATVTPDERVRRQRLRIVRTPTYRVHFRLGGIENSFSLTGLRLIGPPSTVETAFRGRVARLRLLRLLLLAIAILIAVASLLRDPFFWSIPTFLSLLAFGAALGAIHAAAADWTAARQHTKQRLITAASCLVVAIVFAIAALPRATHAQTLIASGKLAAAESELHALGSKAPAPSWAELRLAHVRQATEIETARDALAQIPRELPQFGMATNAVDQLILRTAAGHARCQRWSEGADALALLSRGARGRPESIAIVRAVCVPLARQNAERTNWAGTANAVLTARRAGMAPAELEPLAGAIRAAAIDAAAEAKREPDVRRRLRLRLVAEETFMSWEHATENWGTPWLITLRSAMARDVAAVERTERRRRH